MKIRNILLTALAVFGLVLLNTPVTQAQTCDGNGSNFVDLDGDGFNDNAPDADGDGIPNGLDDDYIKNAQDGDGYKHGQANGQTDDPSLTSTESSETQNQNQTQTKAQTQTKSQKFNGYRFQKHLGAVGGTNGTGTAAGVCDGSGGGMVGPGDCDGTGPNGSQNKGGNK